MSEVGAGKPMYIISSHEHSIFLEMAIAELEQRGIAKKQILALPMQARGREMAPFDTIHRADGVSTVDGAVALGAPLMTLGAIYGFLWSWGPIIWGLIGLITGLVCGFLLKYHINRRHRSRQMQGPRSEVVLIVRCAAEQAPLVEQILWEHNALGVTKYAAAAALGTEA